MTFYDRTAAIDIELKSGEVLRATDLRISFDIEKTKDKTTNKANIRVTNLSQETRSKIREKDALVRLFAGYKNDLGQVLLFNGNAQRIIPKWETPDIITEIEAQDGIRTLRESRASFSYPNKISANALVNRFANELGTPLKQDFNIEGFYYGYAFNGQAKEGLEAVTRRFGYAWSIQNGELQIVPREGNTGRVGVLLTPQTGLINSPERLADQEGKFEEALQRELEWRVTSLLNPRLIPGELVEIQSQQANGVFQIEKVRHYGDTRGKEWYTEIEIKGQ